MTKKFSVRKFTVGAILTIGLLSSVLVSCAGLLGMSLTDRLQKFLSDVGVTSTDTYLNFSSTGTSDYGALKNYDWTAAFPAGSYNFSNLNTSNESDVTATLNGPSSFGSQSIEFNMTSIPGVLGPTYYIKTLTLNGSVLIQ